MIKKFHQFKESISFPTSEDQVVQLCKEYNIRNYSINPDLSIDVEGSVNLDGLDLRSLPLRFSRVNGSFYCQNNYLTTLEGCPREVGEDFDCSYNQLTTLDGGPIEVGVHFDCYDNPVSEILHKFPDKMKVLKFWDDFNMVRNGNKISAYRFKEMYFDLTGKEFKGYMKFEGYKVVE